MASLKISLLGPFQIQVNARPVTQLKIQKAKALLAYLAVEAGHAHPRDVLAGLLWPEQPERGARLSLRQTLFQLRRAIPPAYIQATRHTVQFDPAGDYHLDVSTFTSLLNTCHNHPHPDLITCQPCLARLQVITDLYRGDFLADFFLADSAPFEEWASLKREWLRHEALLALSHLTHHHQQRGDYEAACACAWRQVELDSLREEAHQQLMLNLALSGRRSEALAQYEICRQLLAEALSAEPGEEMAALYQRIRQGDLTGASEHYEEPAYASAPANPPAFLSDSESNNEKEPVAGEEPLFVARERELAQLNRFLDRALSSQGQVVFVTGEAGSGKTALANEFARRAQASHPDLVVATGAGNTYTGVGDPYLPFREVLSMLTGDVEPQWAAGLITRDQALRLWRLLPASVQALVDCGPHLIDTFVPGGPLLSRARVYERDIDPTPGGRRWLERLQNLLARQAATGGQSPDQSHVVEEYTNVLAALATRQPLLLLLDDLHWADLSSVSLLFHLGRHIEKTAFLIVAAYRPEELVTGQDRELHPLVGLLGEFRQRFGDIWVDLDRARSAEGRRFIDALLDAEPNRLGENFRRALAGHTEGHPLFTIELLRNLQERGDLWQDEGGRWVAAPILAWEVLPARVEGVIERRIGRLDTELQQVLSVASVEGEAFTAEVVARVQGSASQTLIRRLSGELDKQHRLVRGRGFRHLGFRRLARYRFRHNLFQRYLYTSLDEIERTYLHEAVGTTLESLYEAHAPAEITSVAGQLARHFQAAGLALKAIYYLREAGDAAARLYANAEAIAFYRQALALARQDQLSNEELTYLYTCLGRTLELDSQLNQALTTYQEMERLAQQRADRAMTLNALMAQFALLVMPTPVMNSKQGEMLGEKALDLARELNDQAAEAKILWNLSHLYFERNQLLKATDFGERSLALARELNLSEQMALTLTDLGVLCYTYRGLLVQGQAVLREATPIWRELNDQPMLANNLSSLCVTCVWAGQYDQAIVYAKEALEISQTIDNLWGQSYSGFKVGCVYWERGELDQAIALMEESIRLGERAGFLAVQTETRADLAVLYGELGAVECGLKLVDLALPLTDSQEIIDRSYVLAALARLQLSHGKPAEAEAAIQTGKKEPISGDNHLSSVAFRLVENELRLKQGDYERTLAMTENLLDDLRQFGMRSQIPSALYLQGRALLGIGREKAARECLLSAQAEAEAIGSRRILWQILATLAEVETDPAAAACLRRQAGEIVAYIADHTPSALRTSFLGLPEVRAIGVV